jgi:hypothetical protein
VRFGVTLVTLYTSGITWANLIRFVAKKIKQTSQVKE